MEDCPILRTVPIQDSKTQKNADSGHTSMPREGFEPTIAVFERSMTTGALDRTVIGIGIMVKSVYILTRMTMDCLFSAENRYTKPET
jgi:hypothetical protein